MDIITNIGGGTTTEIQEAAQNAALGNATAENPAVAVTDPTRDVTVKSASAEDITGTATVSGGVVTATEQPSGAESKLYGDGTLLGYTYQIDPEMFEGLETASPSAVNPPVVSDDARLTAATAEKAGLMTAAQFSKLDGIEASADVTDATNVANAGAVMNGDNEYATVAAAETAETGADGTYEIYWVLENAAWYRFETAGGAYTRDGLFILNTAAGGTTRLIAVGGRYTYGSSSHVGGIGVGASPATGYGFYNYSNSAGVSAGFKLRSLYAGAGTAYCADVGTYGVALSRNRNVLDGTFENEAVAPNQKNAVTLVLGNVGQSILAAIINYPGGTAAYPFRIDYNSDVAFGNPASILARHHVYRNLTGATNPLALFHEDHASNTGILVKGVHDGTGDLLQLYQGANQRLLVDTNGHMTLAGNFGCNGAAPPTQSTYSEVPADISACLVAHGLMAAA